MFSIEKQHELSVVVNDKLTVQIIAAELKMWHFLSPKSVFNRPIEEKSVLTGLG